MFSYLRNESRGPNTIADITISPKTTMTMLAALGLRFFDMYLFSYMLMLDFYWGALSFRRIAYATQPQKAIINSPKPRNPVLIVTTKNITTEYMANQNNNFWNQRCLRISLTRRSMRSLPSLSNCPLPVYAISAVRNNGAVSGYVLA